MPLVMPPTYDVGMVRPDQKPGVRAVARITGPLPTGMTLWKTGDDWFCQASPSQDVLAAASTVLLGGHEYEITEELYDEIVEAGFTPIVLD